ncbi:MAG: hypothetical protein N3F62_07135 [Bacteroidia bacterium]|jgi:hypothetical protein|nr:hypothetical protein [Bacteroidia bacterium]
MKSMMVKNKFLNLGLLLIFVHNFIYISIYGQTIKTISKNKYGIIKGKVFNIIESCNGEEESRKVNVKVCAIDARDTSIRYCVMSKGSKYSIKVPVGMYYVYAKAISDWGDAYYTDNVICNHNYEYFLPYSCEDINGGRSILLLVRVDANKITNNINPLDVFWRELLMIRNDTIIVFRRK